MKILITGSTGFVGSRVATKLLEKGHDVYGLVRYHSERGSHTQKPYKIVMGDLCDAASLRHKIHEIMPDSIIHLGALASNEYCWKNPLETWQVNAEGTFNLVEAAFTEVPRLTQFIAASSCEVYGNQDEFPIRESAPLRPNSPYAVAKAAADYYLQILQHQERPVVIQRAFQTYGRDENSHFFMEHVMTQMLKAQEKGGTVKLGNTSPTRDWIWIDDHVNAYVWYIEKEITKGIYNICTGIETSCGLAAELIMEEVGYKGESKWDEGYKRPGEITRLYGDPAHTHKTIGYRCETQLTDGIKKLHEIWRNK